jgi:23S rRNA pseudouridine1911/1915/1917 synthase
MTAMMPRILYEDNHLIVCVKPVGILSQADGKPNEDMLSLLKDYVRNKYAKPGNVYLGLVHRLDRNVGGVMVFARTSKAAARLSAAIRNHEMEKGYLAVLEASLPVGSDGILEDAVVKDEKQRIGRIVEEGGKPAILSYSVLAGKQVEGRPLTLVRISLKSGRFHQIRLQFSSRGMPLYGDRKYGSTTRQTDIGLFADRLAFPHPVSGETLEFSIRPDSGVFNLFF